MSIRFFVSFCLFIFIVFGGYLRISGIHNEQVWIDELFVLTQAEGIAQYGAPLLPSGHTEYKDIFFPAIIGVMKFFGVSNEYIFRLVSVGIGIATIPVAYFLGSVLVGRYMGLVFSFFIAVSHWHIVWSRQIKPYGLFVAETLLVFLLLSIYHTTGKKRYLVLTMCVATISVLTKTIGVFLFLAILLYLVLEKKKIALLIFGVGGIVLAMLLSPWIMQQFPNMLISNYFSYYLRGYGVGFYGVFFVIAILGTVLLWRRGEKNVSIHLSILAFWASSLIFLSVFVYVNQFRYMFPFSVWIFFYVSIVVTTLFTYRGRNARMQFIVSLLSIVILCFIGWRFHGLIQLTPCSGYCQLEPYTPQPEFKEAYRTLSGMVRSGESVISPYPYVTQYYMGNAGYALAISYTGREGDLSVNANKQEYYSGAKEIDSAGEIIQMAQNKTVYVLLDRMGHSRINATMKNFVYYYMDPVYITEGTREVVTIYKLGPLKDPNILREGGNENALNLDVLVYPNPRDVGGVDVEDIDIEEDSVDEDAGNLEEIDVEISDEDF